ncbi:MAG: C40 family peptidase [Gemmatimonadaceae bacterium]|nr:C40 family peptidase [Gemmatimonadaceae bacterium]
MRSSVLAFLALVIGAVAPPILSAQSAAPAIGGEVFWAHTTSLPGSPGMGGFAATLQSGGVGVRASAGFNRRFDAGGSVDAPWMADADFFIDSRALGQVIGIAMGSFMPVGFVGIGQQGVHDPRGGVGAVPTFSYGAGASVPLFAGLRLAAELRQRRALGDALDPYAPRHGVGNGREIRLVLTFGGRGSRSGRAAPASRRSGSVVLAGGTRARSRASGTVTAQRVLTTGDEYLGVRYLYGGEDPQRGLDCSAFTQLVFRRNGVSLPRTSRQQVAMGREVLMDFGVIEPGDLLFFASDGSRIDHVAIYAGDHEILHATASGNAVRYDDLRSERGAWFVNHLVSVRRVLGEDRSSLVHSLDAARRLAPSVDRGDFAPQPR